MAKLMLLSLLGLVVMLSASQGSILVSPELNSVSASSTKDAWEKLNTLGYWADNPDDVNVLDETVDETADELDDDNKIDEELTDEEKKIGNHIDFPIEKMNEVEMGLFIKLEDQIFLGEADEHVAFELLKEKRSLYTKAAAADALRRRKRIAPLVARAAFTVARSIFRRFARAPRPTTSGSRVTWNYNGRGTFRDAQRDFNNLRPDNVRSFSGRVNGQTGTVGNYRVTVRDGSTTGTSRPTLEVRSHQGDLVRKFRYNNP